MIAQKTGGPAAPPVLSYRLSAISYQLSAISYQLSAISYQLSAISYQLSAGRSFLPGCQGCSRESSVLTYTAMS
jgi:hypothetical protein